MIEAVPNDSDPSLDEDLNLEGENAELTEYNPKELMSQVYLHKDVIITIPSDQVKILKDSLIDRKNLDNRKLQASNIPTSGETLSFLVIPGKDEGFSDVRVKLGMKKSVSVKEIRLPNDEL